MNKSHFILLVLVIEVIHISFINKSLLPLLFSFIKVKGSLVNKLPLRERDR